MSSSRDRMDCTRLPLPRTAHISTNPYSAHSACDLPAPLHFYRAMQKRPPQTQAMQEVLTDMAIDDALLAQEEDVEAEAQISALLAALKEAKLVEEGAAKAIEAERWDGSLHAHRPGEWDDVALVMPRPLQRCHYYRSHWLSGPQMMGRPAVRRQSLHARDSPRCGRGAARAS